MKQQLINDIELLPEHALQAIRVIVNEILAANRSGNEELNEMRERRRKAYGCMKDEIWMADDFDAPLEDMKEYME